jgi:hypothetical protein
MQQLLRFCGTNTHHQNGVTERSIQMISNMAQATILHASMQWEKGIDLSMWHMAVNYTVYIYNNTPRKGVSPADIFTGSNVPHHRLLDIHVWGFPVYVLDPKVRKGKKLPRWQPCSRCGINMGSSLVQHASEVPQVLNLGNGSITTQFHVIFDDQLSTVTSI